MLRRAANNAYSWWWASHVRTKQSKWLEENVQDIEEKVKYALKLLEDEGESFAKRAEMYYKRRPELISFVEESFKAYRALAERYDHISKELQNANTTLASVFPEQVPEFAEDDDDVPPLSPKNRKTHVNFSNQNIPKVPDFPIKDNEATKMRKRKSIKGPTSIDVIKKSGMSKTEAVGEIDKLQKEILALQTEKEFVKSSYENGLAKYWEIENCIMEKQATICSLQDEFDESVVIEDKEAQILMSTTALKSCQERLQELREIHENNVKEAGSTRKQIKESKEELVTLYDDAFLGDEINHRNGHEVYNENENLESVGEKVNEEFDSHASTCFTITDVADKIDELVNNVMSLENMFSSQAASMHRLREEIDDLKAQIRALQKENNSSQTDENIIMGNKLKEMEEKLKGIHVIDKAVEKQGKNIEKDLTQAHLKLSCLSERLESLKQKGEVPKTTIQEENLDDSVGLGDDLSILKAASEVVIDEKDRMSEGNQGKTTETPKSETKVSLNDLHKHISSPKSDIEKEDESLLQQLLAQGIQGREKHLLTEYTKVLRNYKEVKKLLDETETKLKSENTMKDEQVRELNQKLNLLLKGKSDGDDLQKLRARDQKQDQLYMLICREDSAKNARAGQKHMLSPNEKQLGSRIDALLGENLNLLVRFSNSFGQIQKFDIGIKDLHAEILKIIEQKNQDGWNTTKHSLRPIYKHLSEIRTQLTIWLEKSLLLKEEINFRASTLNDIQNEITEALNTDYEDSEMKFTIYQGAKFEGEVSNMKKETNRIAEELQAGLDQVTKLQHESDKTLEKLSEELSLSESNNRSNRQHSQASKTRIPLRSFIFDVKPKKQRLSIFSCIQPSVYKRTKPDS